MSRDYKDTPKFHELNRRQPLDDATPRKPDTPAQQPPWRWLLGGLGIGLGVAVFAYLILAPSDNDKTPHYVLPEPSTELEAPSAQEGKESAVSQVVGEAIMSRPPQELPASVPAPTEAKPVTTEPVKPEPPKYDFYTLLPKQAVEIPPREISRSGIEAANKGAEAEQAPDKQPESYLLQVGSFRTQADAERLRAQLEESGLHAAVQSVPGSNNVIWHRVRLGPYADIKDMEKMRKRLQEKGVEPLVMKVKQ